jgi:hypothetical protein
MVAVTAVYLACIGAREIGSERIAFCIVVLIMKGPGIGVHTPGLHCPNGTPTLVIQVLGPFHGATKCESFGA